MQLINEDEGGNWDVGMDDCISTTQRHTNVPTEIPSSPFNFIENNNIKHISFCMCHLIKSYELCIHTAVV